MARFKNRDKLKKFLEKNNVEVKIHYPKPLHLQKPSLKMGYKKGDFPIAERLADSTISLPVHEFVSPEQIEKMGNLVRSFYYG